MRVYARETNSAAGRSGGGFAADTLAYRLDAPCRTRRQVAKPTLLADVFYQLGRQQCQPGTCIPGRAARRSKFPRKATWQIQRVASFGPRSPTRALQATGRQGTIGASPAHETRLECSLVYISGSSMRATFGGPFVYIFRIP